MAGTGPGSAGRSRRDEGHELWKVKDKVKPSEGWRGLVSVSRWNSGWSSSTASMLSTLMAWITAKEPMLFAVWELKDKI